MFQLCYRINFGIECQPLATRLYETEVGMYVELFAKEIGLPKSALLTASAHDLGKGRTMPLRKHKKELRRYRSYPRRSNRLEKGIALYHRLFFI